MKPLRTIGQSLADSLLQAKRLRQRDQKLLQEGGTIDVVGTGGALTAAYEQLRNAAENSEEHLLLQNAIKRFYRQLFLSGEVATIVLPEYFSLPTVVKPVLDSMRAKSIGDFPK